MGGIWWRGDREFGVLSGVPGGRGILHGAQETGAAGSTGGVSVANGAVYQR